MLKKREVLFDEIKKLKDEGAVIYVGKIGDIKKEFFDTNSIYVADLVRPIYENGNPQARWDKMGFKYVFEKVQYGDVFFYREVFSGATIEPFISSKQLNSNGIYVTDPILFDDYTNNCSKKRIRTIV